MSLLLKNAVRLDVAFLNSPNVRSERRSAGPVRSGPSLLLTVGRELTTDLYARRVGPSVSSIGSNRNERQLWHSQYTFSLIFSANAFLVQNLRMLPKVRLTPRRWYRTMMLNRSNW